MNHCFKFENEEYEIFVEKAVYIKDKKKNEFYKTNVSNLDNELKSKLVSYVSKITLWHIWIYILLFLILVFSNVYTINLFDSNLPVFEHNFINYFICIMYFLFNIFMHEIGHIKSINFFGRRHNKVGFKMNYYVFPSMYVQLNDIYLISKNEKLIVHSAGIFINLITILVIQIINLFFINSLALSFSYVIFSIALAWNMVPVLNSDGYKILITLLNQDELENKKKNHWLIKVIQIIGVLLAIRSLLLWF